MWTTMKNMATKDLWFFTLALFEIELEDERAHQRKQNNWHPDLQERLEWWHMEEQDAKQEEGERVRAIR